MSEPERITTGLFAVDKHGVEITRPWRCRCGTEYTQHILSEKFLGMVERISAGAIAAVTNDIPGFWCPVHCPICERKALNYGRYTVPDERGAA